MESHTPNKSITISTDKRKLNVAIIYENLSNSYWAKDRSEDQIITSIEKSTCFGVYDGDMQIGFARVITDYSTFAYLTDVFIIKSHQGLNLSKWLVDMIMNYHELLDVPTWMLLTNDAQGLYEQFGFIVFPFPERIMVMKRDVG